MPIPTNRVFRQASLEAANYGDHKTARQPTGYTIPTNRRRTTPVTTTQITTRRLRSMTRQQKGRRIWK